MWVSVNTGFIRILLLSITCALASTSSFSQTGTISGIIRDSVTVAPLPYCHIRLKANNTGTASNSNGKYLLRANFKQSDSLVFSCLGYETKTVAAGISDTLDILLNPQPVHLNEVVVTHHSARQVVEMAIARIPNNYFTEPYKSQGFYRLTSQRDSEYVHLSEAVFEIYQSKMKRKPEQLKLTKVRAIQDKEASMGFYLGFTPQSVFEMDIVNHIRQSELFSNMGMEAHEFQYAPTAYVEGRAAHKIEFDQIGGGFSGYRGYMIIDRESFAIIYIEMGLSPKGITYHQYGTVEQQSRLALENIELTLLRNNMKAWYTKTGDTYYLSHAINNATFRVKNQFKQYNFELETTGDYIITNLDTTNVERFSSIETTGEYRLIEKQDSDWDQEFWNNYTILLPTENFLDAAIHIALKNRKAQH